jgi:hypothetical protein
MILNSSSFAKLTFIESVPHWDIRIIPTDDKSCVVEVVVYDPFIGPDTIGIEQSERCV